MKVLADWKLVLLVPAKSSRHAPFCSSVKFAGWTTAVPVTAKAGRAPSTVKPLSSHAVASMLSSQLNDGPKNGVLWLYSEIWQSASSPEETPPAKSHQPQKPKPELVPG
jgi:hypothetical protein